MQPVDHSLNLNASPDERDLGLGVYVAPDGHLRQRSWPMTPEAATQRTEPTRRRERTSSTRD